MKRVLILSGEESGVLYAKAIAAALRRENPEVEIRGYGDFGFTTGELAVFGIGEVLKRIFFFLRVKRTLERAIDEWQPEVVCTIDYPGLNLKLAAYAKKRGIRTVHVVCPQIWAWHQGRIPRIEAALDRLCCFFPFEPPLFRPGFARFVGHPLAEAMRAEVAQGGARPRETGLLAVLPGSRIAEINHHLPTLLKAASQLAAEIPDLRIVLPAANAAALMAIERQLQGFRQSHPGKPLAIEVREGGARELLRRATAAVVASGTATLEAALAACPTVLVYRVNPVLAFFLPWVITGVRHVGLANIIAEKAKAPCPMIELLQNDFTPARVVAALRPYLVDPTEREAASAKLTATMRLLTSEGLAIENIVDCLK